MQSSPLPNPCAGAQQVLASAEELFARHGYDGVSMTAVAHHAGVSKANIFHHFTSKEQLYVAVIRKAVSINFERMDALIHGSLDFPTRLKRLLQLRVEHLFTHDCGTRLVMREILDGDRARLQTLANSVFDRAMQDGTAFFEVARDRGEVRAELDPKVAALTVSSLCLTYFQCRELMRHTLYAELTQSIEQFADGMAQQMLLGMLPAAAALELLGKETPNGKRSATKARGARA